MDPQKTPARTYRCTFTLPVPMALSISHLAKRFRMSQSALLSLLLEEPIEALDRLAALLPLPDAAGTVRFDESQVRRLRGASSDELRKAVRAALAAAEGIDPTPGLEL